MKTFSKLLSESRTTSGPLLPFNTQLARRGVRVYNPIQDTMGPFSGARAAQAARGLPKGTGRAAFLTSVGAGTLGVGALAVDFLMNPFKYSKLFYTKVVDPIADSVFKSWMTSLGFSEAQIEWVTNNTAYILAGILATVTAASNAPRLIRSMKKISKDRTIMKDIKVALEMGDEELARTIMLDAIEDDGFELSTIKRKLTAGEFDQLVK